MSDYFGDTVYEVWRSGGNPDHVDREECREDKERYGGLPKERQNALWTRKYVSGVGWKCSQTMTGASR